MSFTFSSLRALVLWTRMKSIFIVTLFNYHSTSSTLIKVVTPFRRTLIKETYRGTQPHLRKMTYCFRILCTSSACEQGPHEFMNHLKSHHPHPQLRDMHE